MIFRPITSEEAQQLVHTRHHPGLVMPDVEAWYLAESDDYDAIHEAEDALTEALGVGTYYLWSFYDGETLTVLIGIPLPVEVQLALPLEVEA